MSDHSLRDILVQFDQEIERNSFKYQETLGLLLQTDGFLGAICFDYATLGDAHSATAPIDSYGLERLKESIGKTMWTEAMHSNNLEASRRLLGIAEEFLQILERY